MRDDPDTEIGRVSLRAYPDSLSIGNIYVENEADPSRNPTPDDAECVGSKDI
jgi:hypothetical protein